MKQECEICGKLASCGLYSSGCAPVTYNACRTCRERRAESIDVATTWIYLEGGVHAAPEYKNRLLVFLNGKYVSWEEISIFYQDNVAEIEASLS